MNKTISFILLPLALAGFYCQQATTLSDSEKTTISGLVYQRDGATPASGAMITIHPADLLFFPQEAGLAKTASITDTVQTNNKGVFSVDTFLVPGAYIIAAKLANDITLIDTIEVKSPGLSITTPQATLQPAGVVKGTVILPGGGNHRDIFVLVYGVDRFTRVQDDGSFILSGLGEGTYSIRIISILQHYGTFDTTDINVTSADTTDIGDIVLPFDGIPIPQNLTAAYDTLTQRVTLRWNKCVATDMKGYVVYRKTVDSNSIFTKITPAPVSDTFLTDSIVEVPLRFEYRVAAAIRNNEEGTKSDGVFVTAASSFSIDTLFDMYQVEGTPGNVFAIGEDGSYYISGGNCILVYDRDMNLKRQFGEGQTKGIKRIAIDNNRIYALCRVGDSTVSDGLSTYYLSMYRICIFDESGIFINATIVDTTRCGFTFDVNGGCVYISDCDSITVYTSDGNRLRSWYSGQGSAITASHDRVYFLRYSPEWGMVVFDTNGIEISRFTYPGMVGGDDIHYDSKRERLFIFSDYSSFDDFYDRRIILRVFDRNNFFVGFFSKSLRNGNNGTSDISRDVHVSEQGEVTLLYSFVQGGPPHIFHRELLRLDPLKK